MSVNGPVRDVSRKPRTASRKVKSLVDTAPASMLDQFDVHVSTLDRTDAVKFLASLVYRAIMRY